MDPRNWFGLGLKIQDSKNRRAYYEGGLKKGPEFHPWAWRGIGDVYWQKGETDKALDAYTKSQFPAAKTITVTLVSAPMGLDQKTLESFKQQLLGRVVDLDTTFNFAAKAFFQVAAHITAMEPNSPCRIGNQTIFRAEGAVGMRAAEGEHDFARLDAGGQISEVASLLEKLSKNFGNHKVNAATEKWSLLALQRAKEGNLKEAIAAYEEALKTSNDWATYLGYGDLLLSAGRVREAMAAYTFLLSLDVDMPDYLEKVAQVFYHYKEYEALIKCGEKILALRPGDLFAWTMIGHAHFNKGNLAGAIAAYQKPLASTPDQPVCWANMAVALLSANRASEGFYCIQKALELDPTLHRGNYGKIHSLLRQRGVVPRQPQFLAPSPPPTKARGAQGITSSDEFIHNLDPTLTVGEWVVLMETEFLSLPGGDPDSSPFCFFYNGKPLSNKVRAADIPNFDRAKLGWGLRGV